MIADCQFVTCHPPLLGDFGYDKRSEQNMGYAAASQTAAHCPMTRYLTWLALKSLNRSLKSKLTNIAAFDFLCVNDQFPGRGKARLSRLVLPELEVE